MADVANARLATVDSIFALGAALLIIAIVSGFFLK
jgi:hypothetical protein